MSIGTGKEPQSAQVLLYDRQELSQYARGDEERSHVDAQSFQARSDEFETREEFVESQGITEGEVKRRKTRIDET